jgi:hypothetical protein
VVVGAPAHPVALDNVEVLEIDQVAWSLLIVGDLDPYTQPVTPAASLPTGSAKCLFQRPAPRLLKLPVGLSQGFRPS